MNQGFRRWRGSILATQETLTFIGPAAYQNTVVYQIGVNKIPKNFDTLFATSLEVIQLFKGLTAQRL
jgi:O-phosphoseryl-tRNA(Cys) synthetase